MTDSKSNADLIEPRRDYTASTLRRADLIDDPFKQFAKWLQDARDRKILDATAMTLSTANASGQPHARIVLLKNSTKTDSSGTRIRRATKASQLAENPKAALLFYWCALERQVRIEGSVEKLDPAEADDYFYSRPEGRSFQRCSINAVATGR